MAQEPLPCARIKVRVQPRASKDQVIGYREDVLRLRVTAPPAEGKANDAVLSLLAETLGIARGRVRIVRGRSSREKVVLVESLAQEEVQRRLAVFAG